MKKMVFTCLLVILFTCGCMGPEIKLFTDASDPLREFTVSGKGREKVLVISVDGMISDKQEKGMIRVRPSMVQEIVAQLNKAEQDDRIKAVILKINTPGGTVTASDILYNEILGLKSRTGKKIIAVFMDMAASGGYYIALPADRIIAHPTTLTGSIGVIFIRPDLTGLMKKIGVTVDVSESGKNKSMGLPFVECTKEEKEILQDLIDKMGQRFIDKVEKHRKLSKKELNEIALARIYLAEEALDKKLVDRIGYLGETVAEAFRIAALPRDTRVVVYRRTAFSNDNLYNPLTSSYHGDKISLIGSGFQELLDVNQAGFYYVWPSAWGYK